MKIVSSLAAVREASQALRKKGRVGFVPTMGALHEGHLSLLRRAKRENRSTVVSVFVNPLQFGPKEDLRRYPRNLRKDAELLKRAGADLLFTPEPHAFYETDFQTEVKVQKLSQGLCGRSRPVHFAGVATVVLKLLGLVGPHTLYLGQKDYQQYRVLEQMVKDLAVPVDVRLCPIVREKDGLAMSSRNVFLTAQERKQAPAIHRALKEADKQVQRGLRDGRGLRQTVLKSLKAIGSGKVDYVEAVDARSLESVVQLKAGQEILVAAAVFFSKTRLIDNQLIRVKRA